MDMEKGKDQEAISHKQINPILGIVPAPQNGSALLRHIGTMAASKPHRILCLITDSIKRLLRLRGPV